MRLLLDTRRNTEEMEDCHQLQHDDMQWRRDVQYGTTTRWHKWQMPEMQPMHSEKQEMGSLPPPRLR